MPTAADRRALSLLLELTSIPTAPGHEAGVSAWVRRWASGRRLAVKSDALGNLLIARRGRRRVRGEAPPVVFTAHMDHPGFVVEALEGKRTLLARFRGGVDDRFFVGARVRLRGGSRRRPAGAIRALLLDRAAAAAVDPHADQLVRVEFAVAHGARAGDWLTWDLPPARVRGDLVHTPACDDLAALAAALAAFERLSAEPQGVGDVRLLLTRAEEVGFVGAIGALEGGFIPAGALLVNLENSRALPEAPIGHGPIVRVGDRLSVFDSALTHGLSKLGERLAKADPAFRFQRRLMPGGACEATAFCLWGHRSAAMCLPLGNYHNMGDAGIESEFIAMADYLGLVRMIEAAGRHLPAQADFGDLQARLGRRLAAMRSWLR